MTTTLEPTNNTADEKKKRTRKAVDGTRVSFVIPTDKYQKLEAAAKSDLRSAENLAMVATVKYVDQLSKNETPRGETHR